MKHAVIAFAVLCVIGILYYLMQYIFTFGKSHPHSRRVLRGMTLNVTLCAVITAYSILLMLSKKSIHDGNIIVFGLNFLKAVLFEDTIRMLDISLFNLGIFALNASTFAVATKIIPLHNDYKNLVFEKKVVSSYVVNCCLTGIGFLVTFATFFV